jgi:predicted TIM-barrel fold metal-dependent hydrolase
MSEKIFDAHIHVGFCEGQVIKQEKDTFYSVDTVLQYLDAHQIQRGLVFPFPNPTASCLKTNKYLLQTLQEGKGRLYGLIYFSWKENLRELAKFNHSLLIGIGEIHPSFSQRFLSEFPSELLKIVKERKWILLIDSSVSFYGHPKYVVEFAKRNPDIRIICAHFARLFHREILELSRMENVWIDISGISLLSRDRYRLAPPELRDFSLKNDLCLERILEYLLKHFGEKRIVWGSDFPFPRIFGKTEDIDFYINQETDFLKKNELTSILGNNMECLVNEVVTKAL